MYSREKVFKIFDFEGTNFFVEGTNLHVTVNNNDCKEEYYYNSKSLPQQYFKSVLNRNKVENLFIRFCDEGNLPINFFEPTTLKNITLIHTKIRNFDLKNVESVNSLHFYSCSDIVSAVETFSKCCSKLEHVYINNVILTLDELSNISMNTNFISLINVKIYLFKDDMNFEKSFDEQILQFFFNNITNMENISFLEIF